MNTHKISLFINFIRSFLDSFKTKEIIQDTNLVAGKAYQLLNNDYFSLNGEFEAWNDKGVTVLSKINFIVIDETQKNHTHITFNKYNEALINHEQFPDNTKFEIKDRVTIIKKPQYLDITTYDGYQIKINIDNKNNKSFLHIDINTKSKKHINPGGLLGIAYNQDFNGNIDIKSFETKLDQFKPFE
ncbi:MAG: hypothetical protein AB1706_10340 [Pseudomonadota bacterium]